MLANSRPSEELVSSKPQCISARGTYVKGMFNSVNKWQEKLAELSRKDKKKSLKLKPSGNTLRKTP